MDIRQHHTAVLGRWQTPAWRDVLGIVLVFAVLVGVAAAGHQMAAPLSQLRSQPVTLDPAALPGYALRTVLRMMAALAASLLFTFTYATLAAKSRRAEIVLIPLLDVLQSVPILGYLTFTVVFFVSLFPGSQLGPELAAIFAIFTSQAWNMAFSFYQSLRTVPRDLDEACRGFRMSAWQRFWRLEVPFAMPGLVWNMMMSMSGGWFFVVASEAISVGNSQFMLPGVGSYVAQAIAARDLGAVGCAIAAMTMAILLYDQLLFRPLVVWADKFRFEQTAATLTPHSAIVDLFDRAPLFRRLGTGLGRAVHDARRARMALPLPALPGGGAGRLARVIDLAWYTLVLAGLGWAVWTLVGDLRALLGWGDVVIVLKAGALTFARVAVLIALATVIWVPIGVYVGLRPSLVARVQPLVQFLAAFPANLLFPVAVVGIVRFRLDPVIWLSPLIILGTQWYILFNVIAGASAFPTDFREAADTFRIRGWRWWRNVMLPGIFPYFVTGAITASGGAWNASIVAELVSWGTVRIDGGGLGSYIARMTAAGDYTRVALGVAVMSVTVIVCNRALWRPLYAFAERRTRLD